MQRKHQNSIQTSIIWKTIVNSYTYNVSESDHKTPRLNWNMNNLGRICVIFLAILLGTVAISSEGSKGVLFSPQKRNAREIKQWTAQFTHYNIYFNTASQMEQYGCEVATNTSSPFNSYVAKRMMCSNPKYQPRVLMRHQITWKMKSSDDLKVCCVKT